MTSQMIAARIIEKMRQVMAAGLADVPDDQKLVILPKINMAMNMDCVDGVIELTQMDEPATEKT